MNKKAILAVAAVAILAAGLGVGARQWLFGGASSAAAAQPQADTASIAAPASGAVAQLFATQLHDVAGKPQTLTPYKGHVLVVNFWASWCGPCVAEMPELVRLHDAYASKGIQFIGIGVDSQQNVQNFLKKIPVDYPILVSGFGGADLARSLGNGAGALPFTVVIDANGTVRSTKLGQVTPQELRKTLDAL
ncbi:TlpA family protein disulfide reductase [Trinickia acidisoli]|uniref:TlpA family protein disulfide reductase n=1 Tax=Trinickia acidisoli TaxID=2767482 RepID=UPI001A8D1843|nr:TlpA disulfide reductase family protein [Trinickia acidisoli]